MASPQKGSWRQPAQGKCSVPCMISYSQKSQRKWERLSAREKNGKEKNAVAWFVGFHVAAVRAVVIQSVADEENVDHGGVLSAFSD